jgi:peptide subunit release factor 1 (eRF1)
MSTHSLVKNLRDEIRNITQQVETKWNRMNVNEPLRKAINRIRQRNLLP